MQPNTTIRRSIPPKSARRGEQLATHQDHRNQPDRRPSNQMDLTQPHDRDGSHRPHEENRSEMHPMRLARHEPTDPSKHHNRPSTHPKNPLTAPTPERPRRGSTPPAGLPPQGQQ